jgi:protein involved in polysaccharide export with SLBB domain
MSTHKSTYPSNLWLALTNVKMYRRFGKRPPRFRRFGCAGLAFLIVACSATPPPAAPSTSDNGLIKDPVLGVADTGTQCPIPAMNELWRRRANMPKDDYPMGPGDELTISVPEIDELQNQHARISQDGTVSLPLIGTIQVGGLDENQARALFSQRLAKYMKQPRLEMYVERYRSRGVAVSGAVQKPGVYDLANLNDSLNDMIAMAGGVTQNAAQHAVFFPVATKGQATDPIDPKETAVNLSSTNPVPNDSNSAIVNDVTNEKVLEASSDEELHRVSIAISFSRSGDSGCLGMPARPGDVILVPAAGAVTVVGWVRNPGSFPITPGMTVLGAVTAAGGAQFTWHAEVLRTDHTGSRVVKRFALNDLESGTETDIPVEAGDVVRLEKSAIGAVPYGLSELLERFGTGIGMGLPVL